MMNPLDEYLTAYEADQRREAERVRAIIDSWDEGDQDDGTV